MFSRTAKNCEQFLIQRVFLNKHVDGALGVSKSTTEETSYPLLVSGSGIRESVKYQPS